MLGHSRARRALACALLLSLSPALRAQRVLEVSTADASGEPDDVVQVPVAATFTHRIAAFTVGLNWDAERLALLGWDARGTASEASDPARRTFRVLEPGIGAIRLERSVTDSFRIPPGTQVLIAEVLFGILPAAPPGRSSVRPMGEEGDPVRSVFHLVVGPGTEVVEPERHVGSIVTVRPRSRPPRPVTDLRCEQWLDRVRLSFSPAESYDRVVVARDGRELATLPGETTEYEAPIERLGLQVYTVTAWRAESASDPASCAVTAQPPAAPAVRSLRCSGPGRLQWSNPVRFDRILVFRNGATIAELAGGEESYQDGELPTELTIYTVVAEIDGLLPSPRASCLENGLFIVEAGDVHLPLGTPHVRVPLHVTYSRALNGLHVHVNLDRERFRVIEDRELSLEGTVAPPDTEGFVSGVNAATGLPFLAVVFDAAWPLEPEKHLPAGLRQHAVNMVFEPLGELAEGDVFAVRVVEVEGVLPPELGGGRIHPDLLLGGEVRFGTGLPGVEELQAQVVPAAREGGDRTAGGQAGQSVRLTWRNGAAYDAVRVERNGQVIAEVAGEAMEFVDLGVLGGIFNYKVAGVRGGETSFPRTAFLTTVSPPGAFLRGDATRDGRVNLGDPLRTLEALFRGGPELPCLDAADANDDGTLNLTDAVFTLQYLFRGGVALRSPGTRYPWFDPTEDVLTCRE